MTSEILQEPNFAQMYPQVHAIRQQRGRVNLTYIAGSLRDGGSERQLIELIRHIDRQLFVPSLILMDETGMKRASELVEKSFAMGIPHGGNSRWLKQSFSMFNGVRKTRAKLVEWKTDVVHAILPAPSILGGAASRLARTPVMVAGRRSLVSQYCSRGGLSSLADRLAFQMATCNVGNSVAVCEDMTGVGGCPAKKSKIIYNGVDTERFRPDLPTDWREVMGWNNQNVVFGMVANFRACKRHVDFVEAAAMILSRHPDARFVMAGADSGTRSLVAAKIEQLGLYERVRIVDSDPLPEKIFAAMDVCVCTSDSEGFSNVLLEAMACGKPVIATNVGGNPEAVEDSSTGFLVPVGSPQAVNESADKLIKDLQKRVKMGLHGRQRVEKYFSMRRMVHSYEDLYLQLLSEANSLRG